MNTQNINESLRCSAKKCDRLKQYRGWCVAHYQRWSKYGDILESIPIRYKSDKRIETVCSFDGCMSISIKRGFCPKHYELLKKTYKFSKGPGTEEYEKIMNRDSTDCEICQTQRYRLVIDHDHATGLMRGIICDLCNNGLGRFKDNVASIMSAIIYLQKHTVQEYLNNKKQPEISFKQCNAVGCDRKQRRREMCDKHYQSWKRSFENGVIPTDIKILQRESTGIVCADPECNSLANVLFLGEEYCHKCYSKVWKRVDREQHPHKIRETTLKVYKLTEDDFSTIFKMQNNKCGICFETENIQKDGKRFAIDHNHITNEIRGILCYFCNMGVGAFNENLYWMINAIKYLRKYSNQSIKVAS